MPDLAQCLTEKLEASGWTTLLGGDVLAAEKVVILAKWFLGSRRVRHRLQIRLDTQKRQLILTETATETAIGLPPPSFSRTVTKQQGMEVSEDRADSGIGGGGTLHYGEIRAWIEQECARAGWTFTLTVGPI